MSDSPLSLANSPERMKLLVTINHVTYGLYLFSYFTAGLSWLVAIVLNYLYRPEMRGTWLESHVNWQTNTFWFSIVWFVIGIVLLMSGFGIGLGAGIWSTPNAPVAPVAPVALSGVLVGVAGVALCVITALWHLYRVIRGWIALADGQPVSGIR